MVSKTNKNNDLSILIAEDSRTQAEQLGFLLEEHGYQVTIAADGKHALEAAQAQKPTLVISDIVMPEMDGYELCKAIKSDENLQDIPVILVTTLSDSRDVIRGLECGADNFIRKPYDERYLLSRINYLLMNLDMRKEHKMQVGVEINLGGQKYFINSERQQILDLLISTYEQAVHINNELKLRETELEHSNQVLNGLYGIAVGLNHALTEREAAEIALELALALPGIQAGWISLWEEESGFRLVAARNLPPALLREGAMDGLCDCRRRFLAGELDHVTNIMECERLKAAKGDTHGLRYHASVPLWTGKRSMGVMNLVGAEQGLFDEAELKMIYGVGNQVAVALERARLHEHLEQLVEERTAALRQSESWFRAVFNSQQDAVFVTTPEGRIINANTAVEKIFGYSVAELKGQSISRLQVDEQHFMEVVQRVQQSIAQDSIIHFEHELKRKNGEIFPSEHTFSPMTSETEASEGIVRVIRDVTQRKQAEAKLKLFRTLLDNSSDAIEVLDPVTLHFLDINETGCRVLGYSREELLSMSALDIDTAVSADSLKIIEAQLQQSGRAQFETVHRRKDGSTFPVEVSAALIEIDKPYLLSIARDITQRKANEAKIVRLNRIHSVLSGINTTIVRVREEDELFRESCRIT
ncbi:MAG: PAS domain S-box protein, partial [Sideroxydans sp.]